jgi:hypothetical protein
MRRNMEMVIERLMGSDGRGLKREFVCYLRPFPLILIDKIQLLR